MTEESPLTKLAVAGMEFKHVRVNLLGHSGNAFAILATVNKKMRRAGVPRVAIDAFKEEAMSGDYEHLLQTVFAWVTVTDGEEDEWEDR